MHGKPEAAILSQIPSQLVLPCPFGNLDFQPVVRDQESTLREHGPFCLSNKNKFTSTSASNLFGVVDSLGSLHFSERLVDEQHLGIQHNMSALIRKNVCVCTAGLQRTGKNRGNSSRVQVHRAKSASPTYGLE